MDGRDSSPRGPSLQDYFLILMPFQDNVYYRINMVLGGTPDAAYSFLLRRVKLILSAWKSTFSALKQCSCARSIIPLIDQPLGDSTSASFPPETTEEDESP